MGDDRAKHQFKLLRWRHRKKKGNSVAAAPDDDEDGDILTSQELSPLSEAVERSGSPIDPTASSLHDVDKHFASQSNLHIQVIEAADLPAMDMNGKSDPYCIVKVGGVSHRTSTIKTCLNPVWNEQFVIYSEEIQKAQGNIKFQLWDDDDWSKDDFMGQVKVNLYQVSTLSRDNRITLNLSPSRSGMLKEMALSYWTDGPTYLGSVTIAMWWSHPFLSSRDGGESGAGHHTDHAHQSMKEQDVSNLCVPMGHKKVIPSIVNTKMGSLYEEPRTGYICIQLAKVEIFAEETGQSTCPIKICSSIAVRSIGRVLRKGKHGSMFSVPGIVRAFTDRHGAGKVQPRDIGEESFGDEDRIGSDLLDQWMADLGPSQNWNAAESGVSPEGSDQEEDAEQGSLATTEEKLTETCVVEDGTLSVHPYWHYNIGFSKQNHVSETVFNDDEGQVELEFSDQSIFVAVRPVKDRDITILLYTSSEPSTKSSKNDLLLKWKVRLFDILDKKREYWVTSGSGGVKGKAFIKSMIVDTDVRSKLYDLPSRVIPASSDNAQEDAGRNLPETSGGSSFRSDPKDSGSQHDDTDLKSYGSFLERGSSSLSSLFNRSFLSKKYEVARSDSRESVIDAPPPGQFMICIESVELNVPVDCFCVMKCGPHWCRTIAHPAAEHCIWAWEIKMPLYDPATLLAFAVFHEHRRQVIDKGRLRVRLCTLEPGHLYKCRLPLAVDGAITGHVNLIMQVKYPEGSNMSFKYISPALPKDAYKLGLHQYPVACTIKQETTKILLRWLDGSRPRLPHSVVQKLLDISSDSFSRRRLRIHFQRIKLCLAAFNPVFAGVDYIQAWEHPPATIAVILSLCFIVYYPSNALFLALLCFGGFCSYMYSGHKTVPTMSDLMVSLESSKTGTKAKEAVSAYQALKNSYDKVQVILVRLQNGADAIATCLEKVETLVTWRDPVASEIFSLVVFIVAIAVKFFGIQIFLSIAIIWMFRPPSLRNPTPSPPVNFLARLPTRSDQVL